MGETTFVATYAIGLSVYLVFGLGCFIRAWTNHLEHHSLRWALIVLGAMMWGTAVIFGLRLAARVMAADVPGSGTALLSSFWAWFAQATVIGLTVVLFFILQRPRRGDES